MTARTATRAGAVTGSVLAALSLAACGSGGTASHPDAATRTPSAVHTPVGAPTCPGIIPRSTVDTLTKAGWSARTDPFYVGNIKLPGGIQCVWGDAKVATDHVLVYGWAPLPASESAKVKEELRASGWKELKENGTVYMTASGAMLRDPDDQGYGMTYRFGTDELTVADTKQGLLLIQWPPRD